MSFARRLNALEHRRQDVDGFAAFNAAIAERPGCPHTASRAYASLLRAPAPAVLYRPAQISADQAAAIYREVMA